jgi:thiamine biosynthesis lipoprotein
VRGRPAAQELWAVGLADPRDRTRLLTTVRVADAAVATSGVAERGRHVLDPFTGRPAEGLLSVSVVGPDIVTADAYATAALAMGRAAVAWLDGLDGYAGLAVADDATVSATSGWRWPVT